jgi:hypothetical protein
MPQVVAEAPVNGTPAQKPVISVSKPVTSVLKPVTSAKPAAPARADVPPETGYSIVVDGHFKGLHATEAEALANGQALKARFPFLRIEIFDAVKKTRSSVS